MRIFVAMFVFAAACGGPKNKKESSLVEEGSATPTTCCCKTIPATAEKEIVPVYAMEGRMECSTKNGECVPDVQCNASAHPTKTTDNGVPPPVEPITTDTGAPVPR